MTAETFLDGNVAGGPLQAFFSVDITAAIGECDHCGQTGRIAETRVYLQAPGVVVRCRGCEGVLLRVVEGPGRAWLDMRGLRTLQVATG